MKHKSLPLVLAMLFLTFLVMPASLTYAQDDKDKDKERVTICHVAGNSDDPSNYVTITISVNGLNGHFNDGSPRAGHESDIMGPCPGDTSSTDYMPIEVGRPICNDILLYHTDITGDWEIFRMGGNDLNQANLSQGADAIDMQPSLSPDKRWVAFTSMRDGDAEIFVARTNGRSIQQITFNGVDDTDPVWSPLGNQIVYESTASGSENLVLFDVTTGAETALTNDLFNNKDPYWSPDGNKIIFQRLDNEGTRQIFEITVATQEIRQLTQGVPSVDAQYSPDGIWIAYRQVQTASGRGVIYLMTVDGKTLAVSPLDANATNLAWSPQGTMLAYDSDYEGDRNIYVYEVANALTRRITANASADYAPTWYCDTSMLAFTSDVMGDPDLFIMDALPMNNAPVDIQFGLGQLTTSESAETYPHSSPLDEDASRALVDDNSN